MTDTVPKDTCTTGSAVFDDPAFRSGLADLWQRSNPDANLAQRKEQFGWVVRTATGFRVAYLGAGSFCGYDGTVPPPPEGYASVIGFAHTHPYAIGETILACGTAMQLSATTYAGGPSDPDRVTSVSLGNSLGRSGPLPGLIIDKSGLVVYAGLESDGDVHLKRCGY